MVSNPHLDPLRLPPWQWVAEEITRATHTTTDKDMLAGIRCHYCDQWLHRGDTYRLIGYLPATGDEYLVPVCATCEPEVRRRRG